MSRYFHKNVIFIVIINCLLRTVICLVNKLVTIALDEQGTLYKHNLSSVQNSLWIELKNGACHLKEHPKISIFTKFDSYWFEPKGMVQLVPIGGTGVLQSILSSLILKVYHAFVFKSITIKFGKFTNFWMLF